MNRIRLIILLICFAALAILPPIFSAMEQPFWMSLFARIMVFAIAAISLDLILGYGGMISFGHAAYLGLGGYAVAIFSFYEIDIGWLQLPIAVIGSAAVAAVIGAICLRTSGIYFIMITLALTQMLYFLGISLEEYGGDDGINTYRSKFFMLGEDDASLLDEPMVMYYFILFWLIVCTVVGWKLINSRFGMVVRGCHSNEARMQAIGFPTFRYKLLAFMISGGMCGLAGFLLANLTEFVTPDYMHWFRSGEIMIMVLVGGMGTLFGPILGAIGYILLEVIIPEILNLFSEDWGQHWMFVFGPMLLLLVLFAKQGLWGFLPGRERDDG